MLVGACEMEVLIPSSSSLKEKRFILKSIKDRVSRKFNVSVAETDNQEKWQRATIGFAMVSNDHGLIENTFESIVRLIEAQGDAEIIRKTIQFY